MRLEVITLFDEDGHWKVHALGAMVPPANVGRGVAYSWWPPQARLPPSPTIPRLVVSAQRRVVCVASRVVSVDPRGNWG